MLNAEIQAHVTAQWNTIHNMLGRYTDPQQAAFSALLDKCQKYIKDTAMLSELMLAEELIYCFKTIKTMTTLMSSETTSMILSLKKILKSTASVVGDSATISQAAIINDLQKKT